MTDELDIWGQMLDQSMRKTVVMEDGQKKIMDSDNYCGRPVIGKIVVLPRSGLKDFKCEHTWACISILDAFEPSDQTIKAFNAVGKTYVGDAPVISDVNRKAFISVRFDDIEFERPGKKQIDADQAGQIARFVNEFWNEVDLLMVHCTAGISRSAAVAKSISDRFQPELSDLFDQLYIPNPIVYERMKVGFYEEDKKDG